MALSTFSGTCAVLNSGPFAVQTGCSDGVPMLYSNTDLKATLSNGIAGGYQQVQTINPTGGLRIKF